MLFPGCRIFYHLSPFESYRLVCNTHAVHPAVVGGDTGEDGGLLGSVASQTGHKAGNTVHVVFPINHAVQRATGVPLIETTLVGIMIQWLI